VGLTVAVTPHVAHATNVGDEVHLHTNLIVREDALSLFGFESRDELLVFTQLLGVTGVGPKSALGVLAALSVAQIAEAVSADDDAPFRRVSGIGPKTAKLIVVQLAGKIVAPRPDSAAGAAVAPGVDAGGTGAGRTRMERARRDRSGRSRRRRRHSR
jgi:Holliday junction DNA helicase RuvA